MPQLSSVQLSGTDEKQLFIPATDALIMISIITDALIMISVITDALIIGFSSVQGLSE